MAGNKTYYHPCSKCGCNLDPGERCDCSEPDQVAPEKLVQSPETKEIISEENKRSLK